jgi:subtilisin family serine protease
MFGMKRIGLLGTVLAIFITAGATPGGAAGTQSLGSPATLEDAVAQGRLAPEVADEMRATGRAHGLVNFAYEPVLARAIALAPVGRGRTEAILAVTKPTYRAQKQRLLDELGGRVKVLRNYEALATMFVMFGSREALLDALSSSEVSGIGFDGRLSAGLAQSLPLVRQPKAVGMRQTGEGTSVAVLDTGVDYTRSSFGNCTSPGTPTSCRVPFARDFTPTDDGLRDDSAQFLHGTNVAGIVAGVATRTNILALDVFRGASVQWSDLVAAINWTISNQATYAIRAINMSIFQFFNYNNSECGGSTDTVKMAFANARGVGILPVTIAGNNAYRDTSGDGVDNATFRSGIAYPACLPGAVRVGSVYDSNQGQMAWGLSPNTCTDSATSADKVVCSSQTSALLTVLAPGAQITAAGIILSGTSMAAPHVAGAIAVLAAANPTWTIRQIEYRIENTGPQVTDPRTGLIKRRLDLEAALAIDFETPKLDEFTSRLVINPFIAGGVTFRAESPDVSDEVVGIVRNGATSACVEPPSLDQKLGTGRTSAADGGIGLHGMPIKASFNSTIALLGESRLSVRAEFQALAGTTVRLRLFNAKGFEVGAATAATGPPQGTCGYHGGQRGRATLTVLSPKQQIISHAILDTVEGGRVFVIDNFRYAVI